MWPTSLSLCSEFCCSKFEGWNREAFHETFLFFCTSTQGSRSMNKGFIQPTSKWPEGMMKHVLWGDDQQQPSGLLAAVQIELASNCLSFVSQFVRNSVAWPTDCTPIHSDKGWTKTSSKFPSSEFVSLNTHNDVSALGCSKDVSRCCTEFIYCINSSGAPETRPFWRYGSHSLDF